MIPNSLLSTYKSRMIQPGFLKRPYFVFCAKSFSKVKRQEYKAKEALKEVAEKSAIQDNNSGMKI